MPWMRLGRSGGPAPNLVAHGFVRLAAVLASVCRRPPGKDLHFPPKAHGGGVPPAMSTTSPSLQQAVHTRLSPRCLHSNVGIGNIDPPHPARRTLPSIDPLPLPEDSTLRDYDGVLALDAKFHQYYLRQLLEFFQLDPTSIQQTQGDLDAKRKTLYRLAAPHPVFQHPHMLLLAPPELPHGPQFRGIRLFPPGLSVYAPHAPRCSTCED